MGVLRLRDVSRAWAGGSEVAGMWQGGRKVWTIPTEDSIDSFYGTEPGQIGFHLQMPGDGPVSSVVNIGGDGASFDAATGGGTLQVQDGYLVCRSDGDVLTLANQLNLVGLHLLWVMAPTTKAAAYRFFGSDISYVRTGGDQLKLQERDAGSFVVPYIPSETSARLFEMSMTGSGVSISVDGVPTEHVDWQVSVFPIERIGQGGSSFRQYDGLFGDLLAVTHGPTADSAIDAARQYLIDRYAITLA